MRNKTSFKTYIKDIRNWYHVLIGLAVGYDFSLLLFCNRQSFPLSLEHPTNYFYPFLGGVLVCVVSAGWEYAQDKMTRKDVSDSRDIFMGGFGAAIGGYITMLYASWYFAIPISIISSIVFFKHYKK
ncbi:hypothetical protein [Flavobacterium sp. 25HG05S-40]|uniref:hypothetical protein n=1 Tax=Flavobacterium sp. 25HG05S-40 TaxID=3458682 RepID=UPI0040444A5F